MPKIILLLLNKDLKYKINISYVRIAALKPVQVLYDLSRLVTAYAFKNQEVI